MRMSLPVAAWILASACAVRHAREVFRVAAAQPEYVLRAPDARETPFPEVLSRFTRSAPAWVTLQPGMELRIENAYYRDASARRTLANFLGTGIARYQARPDGTLRLASVESGLKQYPTDQAPVQELMRTAQTRYRYHRFFYEILLKRAAELRGAVLLGAKSADEIERLTARLVADPGSLCQAEPSRCTVFPATCTASLEIEIVVNGAARTVLWGSLVSSVAARPRRLELLRRYRGRLTPVEIDPSDANALRLPLLPGDRINWE